MKYDELIARISAQVRDNQAWPDDTSRLVMQLQLVWLQVQQQLRYLPIDRLGPTEKAGCAVRTESGVGLGSLPDDLIIQRDDFGLSHLIFDGTTRRSMPEQVPLSSVIRSAGNSMQSGNLLFNVSSDGQRVYFIGASKLFVEYVPMPKEPTSENYQALDFPLPGTLTEAVVQAVAAHALAVRRDYTQSGVHGGLSESYSELPKKGGS